MKCCVVIVEGERTLPLLRKLLEPELDRANGDISLIDGASESNAESLARTLAVVRRQPVVLFADAQSVHPRSIERRRVWYETAMGQVASRNMWEIFFAVPELLSLLFADRAVLEPLVGGPVTEVQLIRGHYEPKVVLAELLKERGITDGEFDRRLAQADLTALRQLSPVRELAEWVAKAVLTPAA